jgi:hypothetical protein
MRMGRVCGTGAGNAPSPTTISIPNRQEIEMTSRVNCFQRMSGSGPLRMMTLWSPFSPRRSVISGQVRLVFTPFSTRSTGRRARWSIKASLSKMANSSVSIPWSRVETAPAPPSPASIQPSMPRISMGRRSWSGHRST